jgi:hypothetical protein
MNCRRGLWIGLGLAMTTSGPATAQNAEEAAPTEENATTEATEEAVEPDPDAQARELATKVEELEAKLEATEKARRARFPVKIMGYGDVGFFATSPNGDGAGFRRDDGHEVFPEHQQIGWVFYGDLLATMVNSRGDVADLGEAPGVDRFDGPCSRRASTSRRGPAPTSGSATRSTSIWPSSSGCRSRTARPRSSSERSIR